MSRIHKVALLLFVTPLLLSAGVTQTQRDSPGAIVLRYCTLDLKGARLSSTGFEKMQNLSTWEEEPGWDTLMVTDRFVIKDQKTSGANATVTISYSNRGSISESKFAPSTQTELVRFELRRKNHVWQIASPIIQPHVSPAAAINHIQGLVRDEGEESSKKWAEALASLRSIDNSANK